MVRGGGGECESVGAASAAPGALASGGAGAGTG